MKTALVTVFISILVLSSCSKHKPAPVSDAYGNNKRAQSHIRHSSQKEYNKKYVTVKKGDTLYSIGFRNEIDYKTLAAINNIKPPYRIFPGQRIKLSGKVAQTSSQKKPQTTNNKKPLSTTPNVAQQTSKTPVKQPIEQPIKQPISNPPNNKPNNTTSTTTKPEVYQEPPLPTSKSQWIWPIKGKVIKTFLASDVSRKGIDIAAALNQSVLASNSGTIVYSGDGLRGYGELIIIKHENNLLSAYAHNSKRLVKEGETVKQGQVIAKSGTNPSGTALLHFEIRKNGQPVNPLGYLPK